MVRDSDAMAALEGVRRMDAKLAQRTRWPFWRHAAVGVACAFLLLGQAFDNATKLMLSLALVGIALALKAVDKKRDGFFVNGLRRGSTAWVTAILIAVLVASVIYIHGFAPEPKISQPTVWLVIVANAVFATGMSLLWQRLYRAELRGGDAA